MNATNLDLYNISNEYNMAEILSHFDSEVILDIMRDKLNNMNYASSIIQPNLVASFEENFKQMNELFPGDQDNIKIVRQRVYLDILDILCKHFNLEFNTMDDDINVFSAAYYAYDFLVCNNRTYMINFFTSFIINNKDSLYKDLNLESLKKSKDSGTIYNKKIYDEENSKFITISANIEKVINYISSLDVSLYNIFQSTYINPEMVSFLSNAISDKGNFFKDFYCSITNKPDILPVIITEIRLQMQKTISNISQSDIRNYL